MHRFLPAVIAVLALAALVAQFLVSSDLMGSPGSGAVLWRMAGYFTILTNLLVLITFALAAVDDRRIGAGWSGGLTLWILVVGAVYHAVLAALWQPKGLAWWADQGLHTAVPVLVLLWWLWLADKRGLRPRHATLWLIWPLVYCAYALTRGAFSGFYPYPFLDVARLGPAMVALNVAGLIVAFALGGLALVALARRLGPDRPV
ncbi:hypothetical protein U879_12390 [Defluviimonas sp. 20V17]|uniref:Pr6Pr family membrane protein n=1 Tax=Allgaiera indica TaxID=765699 RepID=A0AAN4UNK5_9RHOB|nr:Pr6Pr family membrane protein [Allgaiera indica]KDB03374.1 hypothetical protein U879_12390 [Defluviimonas sp. 20V17]GHD98593.1 hypothetical protein GCM10008024_02730 [Allgaiera indica]SDW10255.1 hypothetical protein SAMN05444006_101275 [Allgaiera indica]